LGGPAGTSAWLAVTEGDAGLSDESGVTTSSDHPKGQVATNPDQRARNDRRPVMSTHVFGITVTTLADASRTARSIDHAVTLVDELSHVMVVVDQRGRVTMRPEEGRVPS
jgi:hypothetical protein